MENLLFKDFYSLHTFSTTKNKLIICLGAGGTGSAFIRDAARMMSVDKEEGGNTKMIICDADIVEESNLKRQCFSPRDLGKNKAAVLAQRYGGTFGVDIAYIDKFIESDNHLYDIVSANNMSSMALYIFSFVDNVKSRLMIHNFIHNFVRPTGGFRKTMWIDCGNSEFAGQVVAFSSIVDEIDGKTLSPIQQIRRCPDVVEIKRDLLDPANWDKFASELSCEEAAVHHPQTMAANTTAANIALNMMFEIMFGRGRMDYNMVTFASNKNTYRTTKLESATFDLVRIIDLAQKKEEVKTNE